jgi:hypothetical protein
MFFPESSNPEEGRRNLRGLPDRGERDWFQLVEEPTPVMPVELESRGLASCDGPQFLLIPTAR